MLPGKRQRATPIPFLPPVIIMWYIVCCGSCGNMNHPRPERIELVVFVFYFAREFVGRLFAYEK